MHNICQAPWHDRTDCTRRFLRLLPRQPPTSLLLATSPQPMTQHMRARLRGLCHVGTGARKQLTASFCINTVSLTRVLHGAQAGL